MSSNQKSLFLLGATGFIGKQAALEAIRQGWQVRAVVRNPQSAEALARQGVCILKGDATRPAEWMHHAAGTDVLIDLVQPKFPERIGSALIRQISRERVALTEGLLEVLQTIPPASRPILFSVSGLDDLAEDRSGCITESSALQDELTGFGRVGIPVRKAIERRDIDCAFIYLATVYGPGKAFAASVFPKLAAGRFRIPGPGANRMPLVHVEDAARALVHLASLPPARLSGRSVLVADRSAVTVKQFFGYAAERMGVPPPAAAPLWLARLAAGNVLCEHLIRDASADSRTLRETEFEFRYPTYREGLPPTLRELGYLPPSRSADSPSRPRASVALPCAVALSLLAMIAVNAFDFPGSAVQIRQLAGGLPLLDMRFSYIDTDLYRLFDVLGPAGRAVYLRFYWTSDLILPALFGSTLWLAIGRTALRGFKRLAFGAACLDYAENITATILLLRYPEHLSFLAGMCSVLTSCKWIFYSAAVLVALAGAVLGLRGKGTTDSLPATPRKLQTPRKPAGSESKFAG